MENNETSLIQIAKDEGLEKDKIQNLMNGFKDAFAEARELVQGARDIVVTSEDQVEDMKKAREVRLGLKNLRVKVEKTRKELKEQSIREGKAIEGMANIIKALIVPVEEHLEAQEKFIENQKALRDMGIEKDRHDELAKYVENADIYSLHPDNLSSDSFQQMLKTAKTAWEADQEKKKKEEADRIAREAEESAERERIKAENEKLKKEQELREQEIAKEKAEQEKKIQAERLEKEKLQRQIKEKEEAERKAKEQVEADERARIKAEEEAKRKAMSAPDKDKLMKLATEIEELRDHQMPSLAMTEAQKVSIEVARKLTELSKYLRDSAEKLGANA